MRVGQSEINASKTHCPRGHSYSEENTKYEYNKNGSTSRKCKECISIRLKDKYISETRAFKVKNPTIEYRPMNVRHGNSGMRLHRIWAKMKQRCQNETDPSYVDYGGRGIKVCEDWQDYANFSKWANANGYSSKLSINRVNNDGHYEPKNCEWATAKQQSNNTRRNRMVTFNGVTKTLQQWADEIGIQTSTLRYRLNNWSTTRALTERLN